MCMWLLHLVLYTRSPVGAPASYLILVKGCGNNCYTSSLGLIISSMEAAEPATSARSEKIPNNIFLISFHLQKPKRSGHRYTVSTKLGTKMPSSEKKTAPTRLMNGSRLGIPAAIPPLTRMMPVRSRICVMLCFSGRNLWWILRQRTSLGLQLKQNNETMSGWRHSVLTHRTGDHR